MKNRLFFLIIFLISFCCIEQVFALNIDEPKIIGVHYVNDTSIDINYNSNNTNTNYKVQIYNMTLGKFETNSVTNTSHTLTGLETGKTYNIIMRVYYGTTVSNWSNIFSVTPKPGVPSITGVVSGNGALTINYNVNGNYKEVEIYSPEIGSSFKTNDLSSHVVTGLVNDKSYSFIMRSCYSSGVCSSWSNTMSGTPKASASSPSPDGQLYTYDASTGYGYGKATSISIKWNTNNGAKDRCGKGKKDYCAAIATVKYKYKTLTYYIGKQNNSGLLGGSCRSHAFMSVVDALNDKYYSTLDLQKYLKKQENSVGHNGVLKGKAGFKNAMEHYNLKGTRYFNELKNDNAKTLITNALNNGQPVMIFVAHNKCSSLAGSHHAILLLGYDSNGKVIHIDSVPYSKKQSGKRTVSSLVKCMSSGNVANNYFRMIVFSVK